MSSRASRTTSPWSLLATVVLICLAFSSLAIADVFPSIDFEGLGNVGVAGAFDGIAVWNPSLATNNASNVFNSNVSSLILRDAQGHLTKINETSNGGRIRSICQRSSAPRTVYVGGLFSQIAGTNVSNIASYDPTTKAWDSLNGGLDGEVLSLYCDELHGMLVAGGSFVKPANVSNSTDTVRYLGGVAMWNVTGKSWLPTPFGGVNGSVTQVTQGVNASTLRLAGSFTTDFSSSIGGNASISGTNSSASPLSIAFTPLPLGQSEFQGGPSASDATYNNAAQILCPQGADGPNNSYLFADNTIGRLTLRSFRNLPTKAIRLANTFVDGRGTNAFNIISIPDNRQLELLYLDPVTQLNVTCTTECPLFHDPSVPYQDFLITDNPANGLENGVKQLTGIQLTATTWYGSGAGLHMLQLLTDGTVAYAFPGYNRASCGSEAVGARSSRATTNNTGAWYYSTVRSSSTNTLEPVVVLSDNFSNLSNNLNAQVSWTLDVPYDGNYSAYMYVPGCQDGDQCNVRTEVQARLINNATTLTTPGGWTRVPQTNPQDSSVLIFSGPIQKSSGAFRPVVQMTIPADAPKPSGSDRFSVYADRVSLQLINSNETYQYYKGSGIGLLEYNVYDGNVNNNTQAYNANDILSNTAIVQNNATAIDQLLVGLYSATQTLPNATMTALDYFAVTLANEGVRQNETESVSVVQPVGTQTFVGGTFNSNNVTATGGFANIVSYSEASGGKAYNRLSGGGLNGPVYALAQIGDYLYVGGDYTATVDNTTAISFVSRYDPKANVWASLGSGVDGVVRSLTVLGTQLMILGDFDAVNGTANMGGIGVYETATHKWIAQPAPIVGSMTAVSSMGDATYLVGQVESVGSTPADAAVQIGAPAEQGNYPNVTVYNFKFPVGSTKSRVTPSGARAAADAKRSLAASAAKRFHAESHTKRSGNGNLLSRLAARASDALQHRSDDVPRPLSSLFKRADVMDPPSLNTNGDNEVIASAFWQRNSTSYMSILGGNFTTSDGVHNLGIYDPTSRVLSSFPPLPPGSTLTVVRAVYVDKNTLYAGGDGGVLSFDLTTARWNNLPALSAANGTVLSVRAIGHRPGSTSMIIAGTFTSAGGLPCKNVCEWDTKMMRWVSIGNGVDGNIAALDFAGNKANTLVLAGSLNMSGREVALATWMFDSKTEAWAPLGSVGGGQGQAPGPATAVSVDNLNANAIFVAGRSDAGTVPYLMRWDGSTYTAVGSNELQASSGVAQLSFVGLTKPHAENPILESNRMLVVSGALSMRSFGNVSSALFDGQSWTPFILSTRQGGGPGVVRAFTRSVEVLNFMNLHHLPVGIVILISIAIGLGVVFLLVLLGLIWALLFRRRNNKGVVAPVHQSDDTLGGTSSSADDVRQRPSSLLATLNKATENVMGEHPKQVDDVVGGVPKHFDDDAAFAAGAGAAGLAGVGATSSSHGHHAGGATTTSQGHGFDMIAPSTHGHSEETSGVAAQSSNYHSDGQTGQSGVSRYYSGDEGMPSVKAGTAAATAVAGGSAATGGAAATAAGPSAAAAEEVGIEAHARYTFEATHQSELGVHAGEKIWILDDQDEHWWLARNAEGRTGVLPASYVL